MRKTMFYIGITTVLLAVGCNKKDDKNGDCTSGKTCFECVNCQGQYGHLIDGEYCKDGFDNCEDWETAKTNYETNDGCDCKYTE